MKKVCLVLIACAATHEMVSHGGGGGGFGGGFATGALLGTGITLAATSGNRGDRSPEYYEDRRDARTRSEIRQQIRQEERSITKIKGQIRKLEKDLDRKNFSSQERTNKNNKIIELQTEISDHKDMIKNLNENLRLL